jgi:hypothetical protein
MAGNGKSQVMHFLQQKQTSRQVQAYALTSKIQNKGVGQNHSNIRCMNSVFEGEITIHLVINGPDQPFE